MAPARVNRFLVVLVISGSAFVAGASPGAAVQPVLTSACSGAARLPASGSATKSCTFQAAGALTLTGDRLLVRGAMDLACRPNCVPDIAHIAVKARQGTHFLLGCRDENSEGGGTDCTNVSHRAVRLRPGTLLTCTIVADGPPGSQFSYGCRSFAALAR
jgi:hypothetical protein